MIPVNIDISDILEEFDELADRAIEFSTYLLDRISESYMFAWENLVNTNLKSTRREYKKAMDMERIDSNIVVFKLLPTESGLAMMIEDGASSWDMKENFSKSDKRKIKPDGGWYLTIPFRHATTEALGESMTFANKMPAKIEKIVKAKQGKSLLPSDLPAKYRKIGINKTSKYKHKAAIYAGLKRFEVGSGSEKRGSYMTFRRVSDNSDGGAFIHPGFTAKKLMEKAWKESNIDLIVDNAADEFLSKIVG